MSIVKVLIENIYTIKLKRTIQTVSKFTNKKQFDCINEADAGNGEKIKL